MTCRELQAFFESNPLDVVLRDDDGQVGAHIAACEGCRRYVSEQRQLWESLRMVRESAIPASESLDAAVLAGYRRQMANCKKADLAAAPRPRPVEMWSWALAAVVLVAAGIYLAVQMSYKTVAGPKAPPAVSLAPVQSAAKSTSHVQAAKVSKPLLAAATRKHTSRPAEPEVTSFLRPAVPLPEEFRSLMYCDPLSCAEGMELIHVQVPSAFIARPVRRMQASGFVNADVLVGSDGIARGIRIQE